MGINGLQEELMANHSSAMDVVRPRSSSLFDDGTLREIKAAAFCLSTSLMEMSFRDSLRLRLGLPVSRSKLRIKSDHLLSPGYLN